MRGKREEEEGEQQERAAVPSCRAGSREEDAPCARREREPCGPDEMTRNRMRGKREEEEGEQRERAGVPSCRAGSREEDAPCARGMPMRGSRAVPGAMPDACATMEEDGDEEEGEQRERAAVPSCRAGSREEDAPCARGMPMR